MMNPTDFHKTAEFLKDQKEEWHVRTTVNRSYYGAFLYLREFLTCQGVKLPDPREKSHHKFILKCFEESKTATMATKDKINGKILGKIWLKLRDLFQDRIYADYRLDIKFLPTQSQDSLDLAKDIIGYFDSLRKSPAETLFISIAHSMSCN